MLFVFGAWEREILSQVIPFEKGDTVRGVKHLASGIDVSFEVKKDGLAIRLPETFRLDPYSDGFVLSVR